MPHRAIQATIDALRIPTLIVSTRASILAVNHHAREQVTPHLMNGANYLAITKEMGWDSLAFISVVRGDESEACRRHRINMQSVSVCASALDPIGGWPPSVLLTVDSEPHTDARALELHRRNRKAVEVGVLLDRARSDLSMMSDMLQATWRGVEQATDTWCERIMDIESSLAHE